MSTRRGENNRALEQEPMGKNADLWKTVKGTKVWKRRKGLCPSRGEIKQVGKREKEASPQGVERTPVLEGDKDEPQCVAEYWKR